MRDELLDEGAIVLVSCYELGHPPLGIAWPAAFLERAGFRPVSIDLATDSLDLQRFSRARLVAISTPMHTALAIGVRAASELRAKLPGVCIVFMGLYAVLNQELLRQRLADHILGGELEEDLVRIAEGLARDGLAKPGGASHEHASSAEGPPVPAAGSIRKLDFLAPSRAQLPELDRYARLVVGDESRLAGAVESTRGCKHLCRHCPIPPVYHGRFFVVPEHVVLQDVGTLVRAGARHVTFADADFLNAPGHAKKVARALHHAHPELTFDFTAKIEHLIRAGELLEDLARHGCIFVVSAVESLSDRVLEILDKGHTRGDVERALAMLDGAGIALRPSLLPFTPWSTLDDYFELLAFIAERDLVEYVDPVQLSVRLLVPPGSLLECRPEMTPHLRALARESFSWTWAHPDPRMDALAGTVAAIVEKAADDGEDPRETFESVYRAAIAVAGGRTETLDFRRDRSVHRARESDVPRLSEPWFC
jgi:radical SAM superfamily enzyme YgiQ (UPF0313 family)